MWRASDSIVSKLKVSETCILWIAVSIYALFAILLFAFAILVMGPNVMILSPPYLLLYLAGGGIVLPQIQKTLRCGGGSGGG